MKSLIIIPIYLLAIIHAGEKMPFNIGEKLIYDVSFAGIKAGKAFLEVLNDNNNNNSNEIHIRFIAKTSFPFSSIYSIDDQIDTWLDSKDLFSKKILKNINQGSYSKESKTIIDHEKFISVTNNDTTNIEGYVYDPYSLFYVLRTKPLIIGETIKVNTFGGKKITPIQIITKSEEIINTIHGSFNCLVVKPFRKGSTLLKNKGDMIIWFSNDKKKIPVQIKIKLQYGSMLLKIKEINL
ncbi:MAG: DUF3108 domain-containing protein [Candidatus Neomarinimicrobiota bacterium]|nr:MAG: DUF3108 domain-containing protein [bacterium]|tara:strand:+ start:1278 stop:1991 length:714 start_codon:yes stop_codon:yes gene_type:complete